MCQFPYLMILLVFPRPLQNMPLCLLVHVFRTESAIAAVKRESYKTSVTLSEKYMFCSTTLTNHHHALQLANAKRKCFPGETPMGRETYCFFCCESILLRSIAFLYDVRELMGNHRRATKSPPKIR